MFTCPNCGAQMQDTDNVCAACGYQKESVGGGAAYSQDDIGTNIVLKVLGIVGYVIPILFFLPLVVTKDSAYGRFLANQMLVAFLARVALGIVGGILAFIPFVGAIIGIVLILAGFAIMVLGIVYVVQGHAKKLPYIGEITLIK